MKSKLTPPSKELSTQSMQSWTPPLGEAGPTTPPTPKHSSWKPPAYQKRAVKFLIERGAGALLLDPGLGKTSIAYAVMKILKRDSQMRGALVIAPLRVAHLVWPKEQRKWTDFHGFSVGVLHGSKKEQVLDEDHDVYVTNHDSIPWLFTRERVGKAWKYFLTPAGKKLMSKVNILFLDELSKFKHADTIRFKLLQPHLGKFDRRYGLTGSPAPNGLMDLFGQCLILDGGRTLGPYITHYREQYFQSVADYTWALKPFAEEAIHARVRPLALSMVAEDYIAMPDMLAYPVKLDLPAEARTVYDEVERNFLTVLENEALTAPNAAAANMMCRQICSGALYLPQYDFMTGAKKAGPRAVSQLHEVKLDALVELVEELQGAQVLIAYEFKHDLENILKKFPNLAVFGKSQKQDAEMEAAWNAGKLAMCAGHPASIGHGLNLQESSAHNIIWYTLTWDFELYDQFNRRLRRQGNKAPSINCYSLVMRDTVEESVAVVLKGKDRTQKKLMDALKGRARIVD